MERFRPDFTNNNQIIHNRINPIPVLTPICLRFILILPSHLLSGFRMHMVKMDDLKKNITPILPHGSRRVTLNSWIGMRRLFYIGRGKKLPAVYGTDFNPTWVATDL